VAYLDVARLNESEAPEKPPLVAQGGEPVPELERELQVELAFEVLAEVQSVYGSEMTQHRLL
jgi:hypothetical protein